MDIKQPIYGALQAIEDGLTEDQYIKNFVKEPLEAGIDRRNLLSAYRLENTDTYVLAKRTGRTIPREVTIFDINGKKITTMMGRGPEIEYRIANFDTDNDPNLYNAYLRLKTGTTKLADIESKLRTEYQKLSSARALIANK